MNYRTTYSLLTYAGVIPFIAVAILHFLPTPEPWLNVFFQKVGTSYSLAILTFMAGTHWGIYLQQSSLIRPNLFHTSNIVTLGAWFSYLLAPHDWIMFIHAAGFALLLWIDLRLYQRDVISSDYFQVRKRVSTLVILCLLLMGIL